MKKEIFKVCTLGLVAVTLVTGCGKESETTKKVAKSNEQEIVLDEEKKRNKKTTSQHHIWSDFSCRDMRFFISFSQ